MLSNSVLNKKGLQVFADTVVLHSSHEQVLSTIFCDYTRKMVPITGRAHFLYFGVFKK